MIYHVPFMFVVVLCGLAAMARNTLWYYFSCWSRSFSFYIFEQCSPFSVSMLSDNHIQDRNMTLVMVASAG